MRIVFTRSGGRTAPAERERLEIDDGRFSMWRSVGTPVVGRFGGTLTDSDRQAVEGAAPAAEAEGSAEAKQMPGAPRETVEIGEASVSVGAGSPAPGAWQPLVDTLRRLLDELTTAPVAAVAIEVEPDGGSARLVHRGDDPITLDLSGGSVRAVLWGGYYEKRGDWSGEMAGERVEAGPGWTMDLPFTHGFAPGEGERIHTYARFSAEDEGSGVAVQAVLAPELPQTEP